MKRFCVAGLAVLSCAFGAVTTLARGADGGAAPIQVVRTWQELRNQPPTPANPGTARLGLEARQAPCGSGVLLYCLTEGYSLPSQWSESERLGPFRVEVRHENDARERVQEVCEMAWDPPDIARATALFRRSIPMDRPGKYQVRVLTLGDDLVAETQVTATPERFHPWMPLEPTVADALEQDRDQYDAAGHVTNRAKGIAIPRFDGMVPLIVRGGGPDARPRSAAGERLPTLFPEAAGDGLTVTAKGTDLSIESKADILLARPDWHFLARWWVNGTPYIPKQLEAFADQNGMVILGKKLLLRLDFIPERIGAKPGDDVELQLLYCRSGWELVASDMKMLTAHVDAEGPELLLSNRTRIVWEKRAKRRQSEAAEAAEAHR